MVADALETLFLGFKHLLAALRKGLLRGFFNKRSFVDTVSGGLLC